MKLIKKNIEIISLFFLFFTLDYQSKIEITLVDNAQNRISKYFVGEKYRIKIKKINFVEKEKIKFIISNDKKAKISKGYLFMKSSGRICLTAYTIKINSSACFNVYDKQFKISKNIITIKLDINSSRQLYFEGNDFIFFKSNHPQIIQVDDKGVIKAIRPGSAIITVTGSNNNITKIKVLSIPKNGLINNNTLKINGADKFKNLMIVAHPDDETLWGGANLCKDKYFVVCLTNGFNFKRSKDYRKILNFTRNSGIILDYPDLQDFKRDKWIEAEEGIIKDLLIILNYNQWDKIVTHGPDGTTGHYHHKKICEYVTKIAKRLKIFKNLFYFGKFYKKDEIPKTISKISNKELECKIKMVSLYKSVNRIIRKLWFHMLPYENLILAKKWKENYQMENIIY